MATAKPKGAEREMLLAAREELVKELEAFKKTGPNGKQAWHLRFFQEDLIDFASRILAIDKKLGRSAYE